MDEKISLCELQERVKQTVDQLSRGYVWITAEISEVKRNANGHWYLELADYSSSNGTLAAKARAVVWSRTAAMLIPFFETTAGSPLMSGMHVLLKVQVQYSPVYGLTLNVFDIDPSFTVGELELHRQRVLKRLQQEGMFGVNSSLEMAVLPKRIAVISSETAAGYRDFLKHLNENEYGFRFHVRLFRAPMQGNDAPQGIIDALDSVLESVSDGEKFDSVVIIRGGGSALELACFDDYELALNIAQFPLPVITGIGHDHDCHVADMVAHTYLKTPTAVAGYFVDCHLQQAAIVDSLCRRMKIAVSGKINEQKNCILRYADRLGNSVLRVTERERNRLKMLELLLRARDPYHILDKGFVIVADGAGKRIDSVDGISDGDRIKLIMRDGIVELSAKELEKIKDIGK